jgi:di/tricarboxylate transporter
VGQRWRETFLAQEPHVHSIGVQRQWVHYPWQKMADLRFAVGDILLVQSPLDHLDQLRADGNLIVVEELQRHLVNRRKAPLAALIFLAMVVLAAVGVVDILVAGLGAAVLMVAAGCITLRRAYRAVDVRTLLLIAGTLALGQALQRSGAADLYAGHFLALFAGAGPQVVLGGVVTFTSLLSHLLSNNSTAVLLTPIAISTARNLGVSARPFIIGLCFGASACYATPIGYQTNLLVYGPGGYRFIDYLRLGVPLDILVTLGASLFIPRLWPF